MSEAPQEPVRLSRDGAVGVLTLNRPDKRNALDLTMRAAIAAAVRGLETSARRKAALLRHIWRPQRFRALLDRFAGRAPMPAARAQLLEKLAKGAPGDLILSETVSGRTEVPPASEMAQEFTVTQSGRLGIEGAGIAFLRRAQFLDS